LELGVVATLPTNVTLPGVVLLSGRVITTGSPTFTLDCSAASRAMVTTRRVDVIPSTGPACTAEPSVGVTEVTRTGPGSKITDPTGRVPVCASPLSAWNDLIAAAVAAVNESPPRPWP